MSRILFCLDEEAFLKHKTTDLWIKNRFKKNSFSSDEVLDIFVA